MYSKPINRNASFVLSYLGHFASQQLPNIKYDFEHFKLLKARNYRTIDPKITVPDMHNLPGFLSNKKLKISIPKPITKPQEIPVPKEEQKPPTIFIEAKPEKSKLKVISESKYIPNYTLKEQTDSYLLVMTLEECNSIKEVALDVKPDVIQLSSAVYEATIKLLRKIDVSKIKAVFKKQSKCLNITAPFL